MSGFGQTDPVRKQAGVQEPSGPVLANASQPIRTGCESDPACLLGSDELHSVLNEANPEGKSLACRSSNNLPFVAVYHMTGVSRVAVQLAVCLEVSAVKTWPVGVVCLEVSILNTGQSQYRVS